MRTTYVPPRADYLGAAGSFVDRALAFYREV
jgi:hypothetical protein